MNASAPKPIPPSNSTTRRACGSNLNKETGRNTEQHGSERLCPVRNTFVKPRTKLTSKNPPGSKQSKCIDLSVVVISLRITKRSGQKDYSALSSKIWSVILNPGARGKEIEEYSVQNIDLSAELSSLPFLSKTTNPLIDLLIFRGINCSKG
jgi:hypothetical protein